MSKWSHVPTDELLAEIGLREDTRPLNSKLDEVIRLLKLLLEQEKNMALQLDDLIADATDETTVISSATALMTSLSAQLVAAGQDPAKLAALKTLIDNNKAAIAAAVAANTPAAPTPPADTVAPATGS